MQMSDPHGRKLALAGDGSVTDAPPVAMRALQSARARQRVRGGRRRGTRPDSAEARPRGDDRAVLLALAHGVAERSVRAGLARLDSASPGVRRWRREHGVASAVAWCSEVDLRARVPAAGAPVHASVHPCGTREARLPKGAGACGTAARILKSTLYSDFLL